MARSTFQQTRGIGWTADPDPEVFEYLVYVSDNQSEPDEIQWLRAIDSGSVSPTDVVPAPENPRSQVMWLFPDGHGDNLDHAVVSHARNEETGVERWSSPYMPEVWDDLDLADAPPELAGPSGGVVLEAG